MLRSARHGRPILAGLAAAVILTVPAIPARAGSIHPALREMIARDPSQTRAVWVFFKDRGFDDASGLRRALDEAQLSISDAALARRARVGAALADTADLPVASRYQAEVARFGKIRHSSRWLNAVSADLSGESIQTVAGISFVAEVRPVARGRLAGVGPARGPDGRLLEVIDPMSVVRARPAKTEALDYGGAADQLLEIGVPAAHAAGYSGSRVILMMLDTGFRKDHDAFRRSRILAEHDFVFGDGNTQNEPGDDPTQHWHGTATWGVLGGFSPGNLIGPAYDATFILAKTEDIRSETPVEEDNYVAALEWGDPLGVMVTSASLIYMTFDGGGGWSYSDLDGDTAPITRAIDRAASRGILCVNAMGNSGPDLGTLGEPADADSMLACGAVTSENSIANFSSRGPTADGRTKPEVVARGVDTWCPDANGIDTYGDASGTSLSTPLVGGACALVLEVHPEWSAFRARTALMLTADRAAHPDNTYGWGRINVWAAVHSAPIVVPTPFSLLQPAAGETLSTLFPTLLWRGSRDPQGGAISYDVWIDEDPAFATPLVYAGLTDTSFVLTAPLAPQTGYVWRVVSEEPDGFRRVCRADAAFRTPQASGPIGGGNSVEGWRIESAPNPWRAESSLRWFAPPGSIGQEVAITIFDATGRRLARMRRAVEREGWNDLSWTATDAEGRNLPRGVYIVQLAAPDRAVRTKIVLAE